MGHKKRKPDGFPAPSPQKNTGNYNQLTSEFDPKEMEDFSNLGISGDEALKIYSQYQRDEYRSIESTYGITPLDAFERINGKRDAWKVCYKIDDFCISD
jgi:hypothetical protein